MNRLNIDELRPRVVEAALSYEGAPFKPVAEFPSTLDSGWLERGTNPEEGFDCSGLAIRCITDALGKKPTDWLPQYRLTCDMADGVYGNVSKYSLVNPEEVKPGDIITWIEMNRAYHAAVALDVANTAGEFPYMHATLHPGLVRQDVFKQNAWSYPVTVPLKKIVSLALK